MGAVEKIINGVVEGILDKKAFETKEQNPESPATKKDAKQIEDDVFLEFAHKDDVETAFSELRRSTSKGPSDQPLRGRVTAVEMIDKQTENISVLDKSVSKLRDDASKARKEDDKEMEEAEEELEKAADEEILRSEAHRDSIISEVRKMGEQGFLKKLIDNIIPILIGLGVFLAFKDEIVKAIKPILEGAWNWMEKNFPELTKGLEKVWSTVLQIGDVVAWLWNAMKWVVTALGWVGDQGKKVVTGATYVAETGIPNVRDFFKELLGLNSAKDVMNAAERNDFGTGVLKARGEFNDRQKQFRELEKALNAGTVPEGTSEVALTEFQSYLRQVLDAAKKHKGFSSEEWMKSRHGKLLNMLESYLMNQAREAIPNLLTEDTVDGVDNKSFSIWANSWTNIYNMLDEALKNFGEDYSAEPLVDLSKYGLGTGKAAPLIPADVPIEEVPQQYQVFHESNPISQANPNMPRFRLGADDVSMNNIGNNRGAEGARLMYERSVFASTQVRRETSDTYNTND